MSLGVRRPSDKDQKEGKKKREPRKQQVKTDGPVVDEEDGWEVVQRRPTTYGEMSEKDKLRLLFGKEKVEVEAEVIAKKRDQLVDMKGKKGTDRSEQVNLLQYLLDISETAGLGTIMISLLYMYIVDSVTIIFHYTTEGVGMTFRLYVDIVDAIFDIPSALYCMKDDTWEK